jgi:hypothetical protein
MADGRFVLHLWPTECHEPCAAVLARATSLDEAIATAKPHVARYTRIEIVDAQTQRPVATVGVSRFDGDVYVVTHEHTQLDARERVKEAR